MELTRYHGIFILLAVALAAQSQVVFAQGNFPQTAESSTMWLQAKALQLAANSKGTMTDGSSRAMFKPQAGPGYEAFWLRDYAYMLEGASSAISNKEATDAALLFVASLRNSDSAGVDRVNADGSISYMPGNGSMGVNPVADGSQFTVNVVYNTYLKTKDISLLTTMLDGRAVLDALVAAMNAVPRNGANQLVFIDPNVPWDRSGYGFTDTVRKSGDVLFSSLLDVQASNQLAALLKVVGRTTEADHWSNHAQTVISGIQNTFWNSSTGLFKAATVRCDQSDIWGSAFAVYVGAATPEQSAAVGNYFADHHGEIVQNGQIRHLPGGHYWESTGTPSGPVPNNSYQNGGYWGTPTGWFVSALRSVNPSLAEQTVVDLVNSYRSNGVNEWTNGKDKAVPNYVASAACPVSSLTGLYNVTAPALVEVGGGYNLCERQNLALQSAGATAFAKDCIAGYAIHKIANLNDGQYGNNHSWVAGSESSYCGVALAKASTIDAIAFGRDNTGVLDDRYAGEYVLQYTTAANPNAATSDDHWTTLGVLFYDAVYPDTTNYLRHLYRFDAISDVTGVRILVTGGSAIGIDELEVYSVPEPNTFALLMLAGVVGLAVYAQHKQK